MIRSPHPEAAPQAIGSGYGGHETVRPVRVTGRAGVTGGSRTLRLTLNTIALDAARTSVEVKRAGGPKVGPLPTDGETTMLLWEALLTTSREPESTTTPGEPQQRVAPRLPYDRRCSALTKSNSRCRGRIRDGGEFCVFHDPAVAAKRKQKLVTARDRQRRRLSHLPDGYLRKLDTIAAVGNAMDRLYREVRHGVITVEMGQVMFGILTRLVDNGLVATGPRPQRTKAARMRPKLTDLLTRPEKKAWRSAVENAMKTSRPGTTDTARRVRPDHPTVKANKSLAPEHQSPS